MDITAIFKKYVSEYLEKYIKNIPRNYLKSNPQIVYSISGLVNTFSMIEMQKTSY